MFRIEEDDTCFLHNETMESTEHLLCQCLAYILLENEPMRHETQGLTIFPHTYILKAIKVQDLPLLFCQCQVSGSGLILT